MKNYVSNGHRVTHTATATILSGQAVAHGKLVGVATTDCVTGDEVELVTVGVFSLPVKDGVTIVDGDKVYLVVADSTITNVASTNIACGFANFGGTGNVDVVLR